MPILMVRHGPTRFNSESGERIRGWLDLELTAEGHAIAAETADALRAYTIDHIYSSDLQRASDTARAIGVAHNIPVTTHVELRPWNLGDLHGRPVEHANDIIATLVQTPLKPAPGDGECFFGFLLRTLPFIMPKVRASTLSVVTSHIRNIKAVEAHLASKGFGIDMTTWSRAPNVPPGGILLVDANGIQLIHAPETAPAPATS